MDGFRKPRSIWTETENESAIDNVMQLKLALSDSYSSQRESVLSLLSPRPNS